MRGRGKSGVLRRRIRVGGRSVEVEPRIFEDIVGGPSRLVGVVSDIFSGENIRPYKSYYVGQVHVVDLVAEPMVIAVDLLVPGFHPQAETWRGDAYPGQIVIIAALEELQLRWFGEDGQIILQAGFLDQGIGAGAAETKRQMALVVL